MQSRIIRIKDIASTSAEVGLLPVGPATIWRWVANGKFPKPFKMGSATVWFLDDVQTFVMKCATSSPAYPSSN